MHKILIVEDDLFTIRRLERVFRTDGYDVLTATDGNEALRMAREERPALLVLDWELPKRSGYEICIALKQEQNLAKILMLTGVRTEDEDEVRALQTKADEYLRKSASDLVLLARVRKLLKSPPLPDALQFDHVRVDFRAMEATRRGIPVPMRRKEFGVLRYLAARAGEAVSRDDLLNHVWEGLQAGSYRSVDNVIASLRKKLERDSKKPARIITVAGVGYKFIKSADVVIT